MLGRAWGSLLCGLAAGRKACHCRAREKDACRFFPRWQWSRSRGASRGPRCHPVRLLCLQGPRLGGTSALTRLLSSSKMPSRWADLLAVAGSGLVSRRLWALGAGRPADPLLAVLGQGPWWPNHVVIIAVTMGPLGTGRLESSLKLVHTRSTRSLVLLSSLLLRAWPVPASPRSYGRHPGMVRPCPLLEDNTQARFGK